MRAFSSCNKQGLLSSGDAQASHCSDFLCCGAWVLGARASVVVAQGLSCPEARGIFLSQGLNPCPLQWQCILNHWTTREALAFTLAFGSLTHFG